MDQNNHILYDNVIGDLALVKSTGEIHTIKHHYATFNIKVTFGEKYAELAKKYLTDIMKEIEFEDDSDYKLPEGKDIDINEVPNSGIANFKLSDGNTYTAEELVIGIDNIRDTNLEKLLENGI
jgi:hypothetical protein